MLTSCGGFGSSAQKYLRHIYGRAQENSCSDMGFGQPTIQTTWSTLHASTYWNMRLSAAGAAKDEGITLFQPYSLPLVHRSLYCRVLSRGLSLEELFLPGWTMGRGS